LWTDKGRLKREDHRDITPFKERPFTKYRIRKDTTFRAVPGLPIDIIGGSGLGRTYGVPEVVNNEPVFVTNSQHLYWVEDGRLYRDDQLGPKLIGNVLQRQTRIWVGEKFGFGLYRAGTLSVAFVFDAKRSGLNDSVALPKVPGHWLNTSCYFSDKLCWFFVTSKEGAKLRNYCFVIDAKGEVKATAETEAWDESWLGTIRGKCAASGFLFCALDEGIARVEIKSGAAVETKVFPDTESFVNEGCSLFACKDGLAVVDEQEIRVLQMA
jgi:hypothetical protein